ncbi:hypothetical protein ULG90_08755 [Halopseudomonas pachastrellae]|nr:hypothetical protein ULG90_08755 [Halopseudomonas pachastrellae]
MPKRPARWTRPSSWTATTYRAGLLGIAAFEAGDFAGSIRYWQSLMQGMDPAPGAQAIQGGIERARQRWLMPDRDAATGGRARGGPDHQPACERGA